MYIHVKFKLCIFRNRFLNISIKDHVRIYYHILHCSMCYIFLTRKARKTNRTLWIMPCFYSESCKALSQTVTSAGGRRRETLLRHGTVPLQRCLADSDIYLKIGRNACVISAVSGLLLSCRRRFSWQQMPHSGPSALGSAALAKRWDSWGACQ